MHFPGLFNQTTEIYWTCSKHTSLLFTLPSSNALLPKLRKQTWFWLLPVLTPLLGKTMFIIIAGPLHKYFQYQALLDLEPPSPTKGPYHHGATKVKSVPRGDRSLSLPPKMQEILSKMPKNYPQMQKILFFSKWCHASQRKAVSKGREE